MLFSGRVRDVKSQDGKGLVHTIPGPWGSIWGAPLLDGKQHAGRRIEERTANMAPARWNSGLPPIPRFPLAPGSALCSPGFRLAPIPTLRPPVWGSRRSPVTNRPAPRRQTSPKVFPRAGQETSKLQHAARSPQAPRAPFLKGTFGAVVLCEACLLYTSPSPRD